MKKRPISRTEIDTIIKIAERVELAFPDRRPMQNVRAELVMAHVMMPLRLDDLLAADDMNFFHDIFGIERHFNSMTLEYENCFVPRFAAREEVANG